MTTLPIYEDEIRELAACEQWPVRLFWPEARGGPGQVPSTVAEADYMLRVCQGCPVQGLCLTVKPDHAVGVWGGYMFGELGREMDTYEPVSIGRAAMPEQHTRPGRTPSAREALEGREGPRLPTTQNNARKSATRPRVRSREEPQVRRLTPRVDLMLHLVRDHPGATTSEIADLAGISARYAANLLGIYVNRGLLQRTFHSNGHRFSRWYPV